MSTEADVTTIRSVIETYLQGMIWDADEKLRQSMHPLCMQAGHLGDKYEFISRDAFIEEIQKEVRLPVGTAFEWQIDLIDVTGDIAVTKVTDTCFGSTWTDYLTLIKHSGKWEIVMKAFYEHKS